MLITYYIITMSAIELQKALIKTKLDSGRYPKFIRNVYLRDGFDVALLIIALWKREQSK